MTNQFSLLAGHRCSVFTDMHVFALFAADNWSNLSAQANGGCSMFEVRGGSRGRQLINEIPRERSVSRTQHKRSCHRSWPGWSTHSCPRAGDQDNRVVDLLVEAWTAKWQKSPWTVPGVSNLARGRQALTASERFNEATGAELARVRSQPSESTWPESVVEDSNAAALCSRANARYRQRLKPELASIRIECPSMGPLSRNWSKSANG